MRPAAASTPVGRWPTRESGFLPTRSGVTTPTAKRATHRLWRGPLAVPAAADFEQVVATNEGTVPQKTLNQSQIDALIAAAGRKVEAYDYHVGKAFDSGTVAEISALHKSFATELASRLTSLLQVPVMVDDQGIDQARFESYVNALPSPTMVGIVSLNPGDYMAVTDVANHLGFAMLDVLLGGTGRPAAFRAFTNLEAILLGEIIDKIGWAIRAAFETHLALEPSVIDIQTAEIRMTILA